MLFDKQLREILETAIEKQKQNKISEAKKLYEKFFFQNPNEITCNINLANLYTKENKFLEAEKLFSHTINLYPNKEVVYLNYCKYLINNKQYLKAFKIIKSAYYKCSLSANLIKYYVIILYKLKDYKSVIKFIKDTKHLIANDISLQILEINALHKLNKEKLLNKKIYDILKVNDSLLINSIIIESFKLDNIDLSIKIAEKIDFSDFHNEQIGATLVALYVDSNSYDKAIKTGHKFDLERTTNDKLLINLGVAYQRLGQLKESVKYTEKSIQVNFNSAESHLNLGALYRELGQLNDAKKETLLALKINPDIKDGYLNLSSVYQDLQETELAYQAIKKALDKQVNSSKTYLNAADILQCKGENKLAKEFLIKSIKANNKEFRAYFLLSLFPKDDDLNDLESDLLRIEEDSIDSEICKIDFLFAKSNIYHKRKDYCSAAKYLIKANNLKLKLYPSDKNLYLNLEKKISYIKFENDKAVDKPCNLENIFIVGMPRCGSTLLESIIATNKDVDCLGESLRVEKSFNEFTSKYENKKIENNLFSSDKILLDKQLYNYFYLDFIHCYIKNSKIIHILRDPLDNLLSIYKAHFLRGNRYASSLDDCMEIYLNHLEIMNKYKNKFDNFIYTIGYEDLVISPKIEVKKLTKWLGFKWSDSYLKHQKVQRIINTASRMQAREKINTQSIDTWLKYSDFFDNSIYFKKNFLKIKNIMKID